MFKIKRFMTKNLSLFCFCFFSIFQFSFGQITYESSDFAGNGESYPIITITDPTAFDFTETGSDFTWDFNSLPSSDIENYGYEDPNNSPFKNVWCLYYFYIFNCDSMFDENFNMGLNSNQTLELETFTLSNVYQHFYKSNSNIEMKMFGANVDLEGNTLPAILEYSDPDVLFQFPMNFNDSFSDNNSINMDFNDLGYDLLVESTGTRTNQVEGYGDLKIRNHVFEDVLKVKSSLTQFFNVYLEGQHTTVELPTVTYFWFDKDYGIPVLTVTGTEVEGAFIPASVSYVWVESMNISDFISEKVIIYPNPTSGKINVQLEMNEEMESIEIIDASGKVVSLNLDTTHLSKGTYILKIQTNKRLISEKIIRK